MHGWPPCQAGRSARGGRLPSHPNPNPDPDPHPHQVGQVEKGASQVYKFPLRVSFFGAPSDRERIRQLLGYQLQLVEPKRARGKQSAGAKKSTGSAAGSSAGGVEGAAGRADEAGEDDVEVTGETSWEERDTELRKHAIELE